MSDEDDYMSSAFLDVKEDIRPGLIFSKSVKRKHEIEKKKVESNKYFRTKSIKQLEEEHRNAGLESALNSENKGFAMLQKMGYKPGMKLGAQKDNSSGAGLSEPIKVKIKTDRGGLGSEEEIRMKIEEREKRRAEIKVYKQQETELLTKEFVERMRNKIFYKHLMSDLRKSQKVCEQLDIEHDVKEPMRDWFWFSQEEEHESDEDFEEEEEEQELDPEEQLYFILDYLRSKYLYCLWCGIKYDSSEDMDKHCPGTEKCDHDE
ncbi:G patch domain-containing protein 11-like [Stegodyphus dumicola]|uniref:G patch domain-containing protein 11-like n=1 Tax=Stegodyphus dumicola TaxID=202533 RepID=UPI0015AC6213|nr:G patch domain-containing protein 11-like [Stegodyphus dumicola]